MAEVQTSENTVKKAKKVKPKEYVKFLWNGKSPFHGKDSISFLHPVQAEKMKVKGFGTYNTGDIKNAGAKGKTQDVTAGGAEDANENV